MHKKIIIMVIFIVFILTGCTRVDNDLDKIISATINNDKVVNTVSTKYELYIPIGVIQVIDNEYNQKLKIKNRDIYLYVDTVSYYYKNDLTYPLDNEYNYYYKEINNGQKKGYVAIKKVKDDEYYCKIMYNYSKVEFYSNLEDLPVVLSNSLIIQQSIKYNDELIKNDFDNNIEDGKEVKYELDKPKDSKSTFSKYLQEYVPTDEEKEDTKLSDSD